MTLIATIPKRITGKEELVVLSKADYENMLFIIRQKSLNQELKNAIREYARGDYYGPFNTVKEGQNFLKANKARR